MHFEVPKAKSFKEFGGEYVMIVISILTALALEHTVETIHHNHLAQEAGEQIEAELHANAEDVRSVLAHNERIAGDLRATRDQMLLALRSKVSDAQWMERYQREWHTSIRMDLNSPTLRREAWEAAVANQAVTWLPHDRLQRYANAYGQMRDLSALFNGGAMSFLDGPRMLDVASDIQMGVGNPKDVYRIVNEMISQYGSFDGNLKGLRDELDRAVAGRDSKRER